MAQFAGTVSPQRMSASVWGRPELMRWAWTATALETVVSTQLPLWGQQRLSPEHRRRWPWPGNTNQAFLRPGQGLSSSTLSNANTHRSSKVNCRARGKEQHGIKQHFHRASSRTIKLFTTVRSIQNCSLMTYGAGWEDRCGNSFLASRRLLSSCKLYNFLGWSRALFCDRCHKR